jgi:Fe-S cluster biogenesis protein NfuA
METDNLLEACKKAILVHVEPALQIDGGRIEVAGLDGKILQVRLLGTCGSCPSAVRAVLFGIEEELRKHLPEIDFVEAIP